jgi:hypothetical protein
MGLIKIPRGSDRGIACSHKALCGGLSMGCIGNLGSVHALEAMVPAVWEAECLV